MIRPLLLALSLLAAGLLRAHEVEQHFFSVFLFDQHLEARLEMDAGYALPELRSNEDETRPLGAWFAALPDSEKERIRMEGARYLRETLHLQLAGLSQDYQLDFVRWGSDWEDYFPQRPDTFQRMIYQLRLDFPAQGGELELFWRENQEGPSLTLATHSAGRELPLVTVSQGEVYSLAWVEATAPAEQEEAVPPPALPSLPRGFTAFFAHCGHPLFIVGLLFPFAAARALFRQGALYLILFTGTLTMALHWDLTLPGSDLLLALSLLALALGGYFLPTRPIPTFCHGLFCCFAITHGLILGASLLPLTPEGPAGTAFFAITLGATGAALLVLFLFTASTLCWQGTLHRHRMQMALSGLLLLAGFWTLATL
ncbi:hypothetical protein [Roseibacillus ishigakijimensis]|uniref:HupE / UreJ protein n=1 Tax=Roseibacillus ishigakijimensis TaxID=454146 RepID=A0A934RV53_9BACT|nr:hypothetical protein [Roseibacillus ishigakijimensis]MBK1835584.1 hypothetical protein [Roseibacillus ishigakijimensis]